MLLRSGLLILSAAIVGFISLFPLTGTGAVTPAAGAASAGRIFELRTYTTAEGRLDALHKRFREHTNDLFKKHGMELIAFWTPTDGPTAKNTLIYVLAYPSREAATKAWKDFQDDPDWKKAKDESEKDGKIVIHVDSVFMTATDFSPMK